VDHLRSLVVSPEILVVAAGADVHASARVHPDVLVLAEEDVIGSARRAAQPPIVLWTDEPGAAIRLAQWNVPSWGVVRRKVPARQMQAAVLAVASGLCVIPPGTAVRVPSETRDEDFEGQMDLTVVEPLTAREREVLDLASQGLSNRAIGAVLGISEHTVKFHLAAIYGKLGVTTRTAAVRRGLRRGIIEI